MQMVIVYKQRITNFGDEKMPSRAAELHNLVSVDGDVNPFV